MDLENPAFQSRGKILVMLLEMGNRISAAKVITAVKKIKEWIHNSAEEPELLLKQLQHALDEFQKKEIPDVKQEFKKESKKEDATETAVFIKNSGLIIFHPFLTNLFEKTRLMYNNSFKDDESRSRAVHLLQYIADGQEQLL